MKKSRKKKSLKKAKKKKNKIKEIKKKYKEIEKSELEKNIKETEEVVEDNEFREFLQSSTSPAPVLTKVETPDLEMNIASSPVAQTKEKETGINYGINNESKYSGDVTTNDDNEKKYESDSRIQILNQTDSRRLRQEILEPPREVEVEKKYTPEGIETNILEQRRREPFEVGEEKYKEVDVSLNL
jgi:hypothetical protein